MGQVAGKVAIVTGGVSGSAPHAPRHWRVKAPKSSRGGVAIVFFLNDFPS